MYSEVTKTLWCRLLLRKIAMIPGFVGVIYLIFNLTVLKCSLKMHRPNTERSDMARV